MILHFFGRKCKAGKFVQGILKPEAHEKKILHDLHNRSITQSRECSCSQTPLVVFQSQVQPHTPKSPYRLR